jgi:hypothetical protein
MQTFHIIVLSIALVILILLLTFVGILMGKQHSTQPFPPLANTCPDYWQVSSDGTKCIIPNANSINTGKLYTGAILTSDAYNASIFPGFSSSTDSNNQPVYSMNFNDPGWSGTGVQGICSKRNWAKNYNIEWDGISNYTNCTTTPA